MALAYLDDEAALVEAARRVSELNQYDPEAGDACVLWCCAIRHAVLNGVLDARIGLQHMPSEGRGMWASRLDVAEASKPADFMTATKDAFWITRNPFGADFFSKSRPDWSTGRCRTSR